MRKALCNKNEIIQEDGSLNLKYFNAKKGHYWSRSQNEKLIQAVLKFGVSDIKTIKDNELSEWTETEIRLRICKLLKCYNIEEYKDKKFHSQDDIFELAKANKHAGIESKKLLGGVFYNPVHDQGATNDLLSSFFRK